MIGIKDRWVKDVMRVSVYFYKRSNYGLKYFKYPGFLSLMLQL